MKKLIVMLPIILLFSSIINIASEDLMTMSNNLYEKGKKDWNTDYLEKAKMMIAGNTHALSVEESLLLGKIHYRIALILFIEDEDPDDYAEEAEKHLQIVLNKNPKLQEPYWYLAKTYQILAQGGIFAGPKYGKKVGEMTKLLENLDSGSFYVKYIQAVNYLLTPSMFGGDTEKAKKMLSELSIEYPEDEDIAAYYAQALLDEEEYDKCLNIIENGLKKNPNNLFFKKIQIEVIDELN